MHSLLLRSNRGEGGGGEEEGRQEETLSCTPAFRVYSIMNNDLVIEGAKREGEMGRKKKKGRKEELRRGRQS